MRADSIFLLVCSRSCLLLFLLWLPAGCSRNHPGEDLYLDKCSQCHAVSGQGLRKLYPPLDKSPYLSTRIDKLPCLIIHGSRVTMNTADRRQGSYMPPIQAISRAEMLLLFDYLQQRWSTNPVPVSEQILVKWLSRCTT